MIPSDNTAAKNAASPPKEDLFNSWLSGMVPMLSVPDADDSETEEEFFFANDIAGTWRNPKKGTFYGLLVHTETHGKTEWEAALLESGSGRWVMTCRHDLADGLVRFRLVDEASGWWMTLREEMPVEERFDRDVTSSSRVGELYSRHLKSPYQLTIDWRKGWRVEVETVYENAVLSIAGPKLVAAMREKSLVHSFARAVPTSMLGCLGDLVSIVSSRSSRSLMRFEKMIRLLFHIVCQSQPHEPISPRDWTFQLDHDVVYKEREAPLDPITVATVARFESMDEELLAMNWTS